MANWAYIENNQIKEVVDELPKNWRNVSNLDALENNLDLLKNLGWYPIVHNNLDYDPNVQKLVTLNMMFNGEKVVEIYTVESISVETLYYDFIEQLREKRNQLLEESDFMCLYDLVQQKGVEYVNDVTKYRQSLRDLPAQYSIENAPHNFSEVKWPNKPNLNDYPKTIDPNIGGVI